MARQVLPIVGAVAGFVITGGNPYGAQVGFALGSLVGNAVDPIEMQGRKLGDSPTQVAAEGGARAIVYGKGCIRATCIIERGGRRVIKQRDSSGGKGGGPTTINERALWTFAIGLGEPVAAILRIWENEKLVYDVTPTSTIPEDTAQFAEKFRFYTGAEDQLPDPALEALHGADTPYYRGTAYMVFPQYDLTDFGETVPTYRVEVASAIEGSEVQLLAFMRSEIAGYVARLDADFSGDFVVRPILERRVGIDRTLVVGGRVITHSDGAVLPAFTDDEGSTFQVSDGSWSGFAVGQGWVNGNVLIYPGSLSTMRRSLDGGGTFADLPSSPRSSAIAGIGNRWISVSAVEGEANYSVNDGASWSDGVTLPVLVSVYARGANDSVAMFTGVSGVGVNSIISTPDGEEFTLETIPSVTGEIHCIHAFGERWVAATADGEILYKDETGWHLSDDSYDCHFFSITNDGEQFILIGGQGSSGDETGRILTSPTGEDWTVRRSDALSHFQQWESIAAIVQPPQVVGAPIPLSTVVALIHERCGHTGGDYDVGELSELIVGVVIESTVTGSEGINSIIGSHFADPSDYDGQIHYIKRGKPVVLTLTEDDLIDEPDEAQRNNAIEYPKKVHFLGQRADLAYASSKSTSARYSDDARVVGEITIGSPETYNDGTAPAEVAVKLHKVLWTEAEGEREWMIPDNYLGLVPTDNVGLSYRGELVRCRIINVEDTPGQRKLRMIRDRQSAYTANLTEIPNPPAPTPPQSSIVAPTVMAFIDTSALTDNADTLHYLVALSGANDNWAGAVLQQQLGGSFSSIDSTTLNSIMGTLQNTVTDAAPWYTDTTNTVVVRLYTDDELESRTDAEFLSNGGAFFLSWEDSGTTQWEIMQFRDAVQDSNGHWVLSHLMRGRKNTETAEHPPGATFVWIDPAILREPAQTSWINTVLAHRAVSNGQSPELAAIQNNEYVGNSQREWPVADLLLSRPTADSVLAEAIPRYRFGTSMNPIRSQNMEQFTWSATDGVNTTTVQTPFTTPSYTFDTTGWVSPVTVTVAQWNRLTGDGPTVSEEIV